MTIAFVTLVDVMDNRCLCNELDFTSVFVPVECTGAFSHCMMTSIVFVYYLSS